MPRLHLTTKAINSLKPTNKRVEYYDTSFKSRGVNFGVRVSSSGSKEYFIRYRDGQRRQRRYNLGDAKLSSLSDVREKARRVASKLDNDVNPAQERHTHKLAETVEELCNLYYAKHAKFKKDGGAEDLRMLKKDVIPYIGQMKAREVGRKDIIALIERVAVDRGAKVGANRLRALLSMLFNFASQRELIGASPCVGLPKKPKEKPKTRVLTEDEIREFWSWLDNEPLANSAVLKLILLTGQRPIEVAGMQWDELKGNSWEISGARTKNSNPQLLPLSKGALEIIESLMPMRNGTWVFTGERSAHIKPRTLQHTTERMTRELSGQRFTPHDLRRTAATYLRKQGVTRDVVARILNHTEQSVTAVYDRHDLLPEMKSALELWGEELERICGLRRARVKVIAISRK